jgi:hypothetical protein
MLRKNRRKHGWRPDSGSSARFTLTPRRIAALSLEDTFTALELEFFRRGEESELECREPIVEAGSRPIWSLSPADVLY